MSQFVSPIGRIVQGGVCSFSTTDYENNPLIYKTGKRKGEPRENWYFSVAFDKSNPEIKDFIGQIKQFAIENFPSLFENGKLKVPKFAFKIVDGDSETPNENGVAPCVREGFKGCWVVLFTNSNQCKCYDNGKPISEIKPEIVKTGYFVRVSGNMSPNGSRANPGIFMNHNCVQLVGQGEIIVVGSDGSEFKNGSDYIPPGMTVNPAIYHQDKVTASNPNPFDNSPTTATHASPAVESNPFDSDIPF